jgi:hypothetical protein
MKLVGTRTVGCENVYWIELDSGGFGVSMFESSGFVTTGLVSSFQPICELD